MAARRNAPASAAPSAAAGAAGSAAAPTILAARPAAAGPATLLPRHAEARRLFVAGGGVQAEVFGRHTDAQELVCVAVLGSERQRVARQLGGDGAADAWLTGDAALVTEAGGGGADDADDLGSAALAWSAADVVLYAAASPSPALLLRVRLVAALALAHLPAAPPHLVLLCDGAGTGAALEAAAAAAAGGAARSVRVMSAASFAGLGSLGALVRALRRPLVPRDWARALARAAAELRSGSLLNECARTVL